MNEGLFSMVKKLKFLIASISALALVALFFMLGGVSRLNGLVNTVVDEPKAAVQEVMKIEDPLAYFREDRMAVRQEEIKQLQAIVDSESASEENRSAAHRQIIDLTSWMEKETTIEGVLRARKFEDVVVTVHTDSVNVLIRTELVTQSESATILELVMRETGISGGNIKIIPIN